MKKINNILVLVFLIVIGMLLSNKLVAQNTKIRGFADVSTFYQDDQLNFGLGEYDLFITSELGDHFSFLGETVFRYDPEASTKFGVGVERVIIKYNYTGNHSVLFGKHHTPINYWNDAYHHGRVFFPTIDRPLLFQAQFIPLHTAGIALTGLNLGKLKFGYNLMVGNGIGSEEIKDNDKYKSVTAAVHIKPIDFLQIGLSFYNDIISEGTEFHHGEDIIIDEQINQQLYTGSVAHFGQRFELLTEGTVMNNTTDSSGSFQSFASYLYAGYIIKEKWVPYVRLDYLNFANNDPYLIYEDTTSVLIGARYEINYLMVVKLEYKYEDRNVSGIQNSLTAQFAIGF